MLSICFLICFWLDILATLEKQNLMTEREQLNISLTQSHNRNTNLTEEKDELQTRYDILNKNCNLLQDELDKLRTKFENCIEIAQVGPEPLEVIAPTLPTLIFPPEFFLPTIQPSLDNHDLDDWESSQTSSD